MKKIYSLFAAVVMAVTMNAQTTVNFVMADQSWTNSQVIASGNIDPNLSFTTSKNGSSTAPTYFTGDSSLRFYFIASGNGGGMTITPKNGAKISSITITGVTGNLPTVKYSVDGAASATATLTGNSYTVSGITAATSFMFQNANTTNTQLRVTSISVTYDIVPLATGDVNATKANLVKNTVVADAIVFSAKADVQVVNMNGQVVKSASVNENSTLDVSTLTKGTYIVTGNVAGKAVSQKIIKK